MTKRKEPLRVLIIDDDQDDFLIISDFLNSIETIELKIDWCYSYQQAVKQIAEQLHEIYFVDYRLGAKTGIDLLHEAEVYKCEEPIILLTGNGNPEVDNEAMRMGAMDYLIKSELTSEKLERCIRYSLERSATLKALRANELKFRNIFERSKDAVFITNVELQFKDVNSATSQLLGVDKEKLQALNLYDLIEDAPSREKLKIALELTGEISDLELVLVTQQQEKKYCILSASTQFETNGEKYIQGILHDITNLKKAERATLHAEKLAAAGRLVRTLAHEVRNPLNNIQMAVEQLNGCTDEEDKKIYLDIILRNSKRINNLIGELLDSYRPNEKAFKEVPLQFVLDESIQGAADRIKLKSIAINVQYPDDPCVINADDDKLRIAFLNILVNASEAIAHGNGMINVSLRDDDKSFIVEISDNGCGIPTEILSKLFEPYFTSKRNGMGLGLASTLNIIQAHGGTVDVKSEVNQGSTFIMHFPK